ncbi:MAG: stimulus-sensing domain-containing protein [Spirochaetales bacterium]|nr:stimulus-sensing domain-containing protein [Spirochaetales bacterium]
MKKLKLFTVSATGIGRFLLSITFRLMLFNIILVFLPVASILYLDTYERQLLDAQEKSMVQQGRLFSAALSDSGSLDAGRAKNVLTSLKGRTDARLRVLDENGTLIADSSSIYKSEIKNQNTVYTKRATSMPGIDRDSILYRIAIWPVRIYRKLFNPPLPVAGESYYNSGLPFNGTEVRAALNGRYGAVTRLSSDGQRSVSLYIAIPVTNGGAVIGAILCSQSTYRILQDLYEVRIVLLKIFLWSFLFAMVISIFLSFSISFRIKRLRNDAESIRTGKGRLEGYFTPSSFMDEIGELSFSLKDLTSRLDRHIRYTASFIQDFSHEFKNPLSVVRTASEMVPESGEEQRDRFLQLIDQNSRRMESLLEGIREQKWK